MCSTPAPTLGPNDNLSTTSTVLAHPQSLPRPQGEPWITVGGALEGYYKQGYSYASKERIF